MKPYSWVALIAHQWGPLFLIPASHKNSPGCRTTSGSYPPPSELQVPLTSAHNHPSWSSTSSLQKIHRSNQPSQESCALSPAEPQKKKTPWRAPAPCGARQPFCLTRDSTEKRSVSTTESQRVRKQHQRKIWLKGLNLIIEESQFIWLMLIYNLQFYWTVTLTIYWYICIFTHLQCLIYFGLT